MDSSAVAVCPGSPSGAAVPRTKQTQITIQKTIVYGNRPAAASNYLLHSPAFHYATGTLIMRQVNVGLRPVTGTVLHMG